MNKLITKARSGVTLVELLVVILIVTILSVSMLPLLQPFVTEAQYAAESIPVIGNLRTKIGVYAYDKGALPCTNDLAGANTLVQTWKHKTGDDESYLPAVYAITGTSYPGDAGKTECSSISHIQGQIKTDYEDMKGRRSKPVDYHYFPISAVSNQSYAVACFGNGGDSGLKAGTGYAVCELTFTSVGKKYIGTWKQYKPKNDGGPLFFTYDQTTGEPDAAGRFGACYLPDENSFLATLPASTDTSEPTIIGIMRERGWEF